MALKKASHKKEGVWSVPLFSFPLSPVQELLDLDKRSENWIFLSSDEAQLESKSRKTSDVEKPQVKAKKPV